MRGTLLNVGKHCLTRYAHVPQDININRSVHAGLRAFVQHVPGIWRVRNDSDDTSLLTRQRQISTLNLKECFGI